jgi:hypothetical protein
MMHLSSPSAMLEKCWRKVMLDLVDHLRGPMRPMSAGCNVAYRVHMAMERNEQIINSLPTQEEYLA